MLIKKNTRRKKWWRVMENDLLYFLLHKVIHDSWCSFNWENLYKYFQFYWRMKFSFITCQQLTGTVSFIPGSNLNDLCVVVKLKGACFVTCASFCRCVQMNVASLEVHSSLSVTRSRCREVSEWPLYNTAAVGSVQWYLDLKLVCFLFVFLPWVSPLLFNV